MAYECVYGTPPFYELEVEDAMRSLSKSGISVLIDQLNCSDMLKHLIRRWVVEAFAKGNQGYFKARLNSYNDSWLSKTNIIWKASWF